MKKIKNSAWLRKWLPLAILSTALMIIIIDTTVLNVSIKDMIGDLKTNVQAIQWVISAYALTLAALTVTGGRLGDLFGRKKVFKIGAVLFAIGSVITALAPTIAWVIFGNAIIEGIGAALMMPATASLLMSTYQGKDRALAFAFWGSVAASAAAIGPILGGWLTTNYSWRWAFGINVVVVAILLLGSRVVKESRDKLEKQELDMVGVLLSSLGLVSIVYGLIESSTYGWWMAKAPFQIFGLDFSPFGLSVTPITITLGLAILFAFIKYEQKHEAAGHTPLVSLNLFKNRQFTVGSVATALSSIGQSGIIFSVPIFYQSVLLLDAFHTGIGLLPMSLAVMIGAPIGLGMGKKLLPKHIIQLGFLLNLIGILYLYFTISTGSSPLSFAPGLFLYGFGMGLAFSHLSNLTLSAVSVEQSGEASGVNNTLRQVGTSFGSAIIGAALIATLTSGVVTKIEASKVLPDQAKPAIVEQVKKAGSNIEFSEPTKTNAPAKITNEVLSLTHQATVDANKVALSLTALFTIICLIFSQALPSIKNLETSKKIPKPAH